MDEKDIQKPIVETEVFYYSIISVSLFVTDLQRVDNRQDCRT